MNANKRPGGGLGILLIVVALAFIVGPNLLPFIPGASKVLLTGFGALVLVVGFIITVITHLYVKTSADIAYVRTGSGGPKVVMDGGAIVVPTVHNIVWVSLETMKLTVKRNGETALITGDKLRADITSEFFIKVAKVKEDILAAATSLGSKLLDPQQVLGVVEDKLVSALRDVAAKQSLNDLNTKRAEFIRQVQEIVSQDLKHNGLTLETVTISFLDQTPLTAMKADQNIFDAEGALTIAEIVNARKVERNKIEREAEQSVKAQNVETDQFIFGQDVTRAQAEANRDANIRTVKAQKDREAATVEAEQSREAEIAGVQKEQAVQVAEVTRAQAVQVADQDRERASETARIAKETAVETAVRMKQITIATKERERAQAEAARLDAEKDRETAAQAVTTVGVTAEAERNKAKAVIGKEAEAAQTRIERQVEADVAAYTQVKQAEGEREAATEKATARLTLAEAEKNARLLEATGEQAVQIVPVNVERERVSVESARVDVERKNLENKQQFEKVAVELQIRLAQIAAEKDARIEAARAFGQALAAANITMWSDPNTLNSMVQSWVGGQQNGQFFAGLATTMPPALQTLGLAGGMTIGKVGRMLLKKFADIDVPEEMIERIAKEAASEESAKPDDGKAAAAAVPAS